MNAMASRIRFVLLRTVLTGLIFLTLASCAVNPATGEQQLSFLSEAQEIEMGRESDPEIVASMGLYPDDDLQEYVQELGRELAGASERPDLPWTFRLLDQPAVNAFAVPGGFIYVTRGILAYLQSEAELVGILGHEIGHVTARHSVNRISRAQLAQLGLGVGMILAPELQRFQNLAGASLQLLFLKFSRDDERQADQLGVRYMSRVGYEPAELSGVMGMLSQVTSAGGGQEVPEWLSTHPNPENREERILEMAREAEVAGGPVRVDREAFLRRLDGLVFGENPRNGFFQGEAFYHPDMAFRMDFPRGWNTANLAQAVQGVSPEEDAIVVLSLAREGTPAQALETFLGQEGLEAGPVSRSPVNGNPAASAPFRATAEQGALEGRALFVQHQGQVFQLLGYAPEADWSGRQGAVVSSLTSFRALTDPSYLNVQPTRLKVRTLQRSMPLSALLRQEGVEGRAQDVRLLNRLEGDPTLEAGRMVKIPVGGDLPGSL
jgi:predicted Zn-dependent protease